jgi:hypothetical protein
MPSRAFHLPAGVPRPAAAVFLRSNFNAAVAPDGPFFLCLDNLFSNLLYDISTWQAVCDIIASLSIIFSEVQTWNWT